MTNTSWRQSASPPYQKLQLLKFNDFVKLQLSTVRLCILFTIINFQICILVSLGPKTFILIKLEILMSNYIQTSARTEKSKSIISFPGPKYGVGYSVI